jgi:hypothetical protein
MLTRRPTRQITLGDDRVGLPQLIADKLTVIKVREMISTPLVITLEGVLSDSSVQTDSHHIGNRDGHALSLTGEE